MIVREGTKRLEIAKETTHVIVPRRPALRRQLRRPRWVRGGADAAKGATCPSTTSSTAGARVCEARGRFFTGGWCGLLNNTDVRRSSIRSDTQGRGSYLRRFSELSASESKGRETLRHVRQATECGRGSSSTGAATAATQGQPARDRGREWSTHSPKNDPGPGAANAGHAAAHAADPPRRRGHTKAKQGRL